jgi:hypothetical protein
MAGLNCTPAVITNLQKDRTLVRTAARPITAEEKTEAEVMTAIELPISRFAH